MVELVPRAPENRQFLKCSQNLHLQRPPSPPTCSLFNGRDKPSPFTPNGQTLSDLHIASYCDQITSNHIFQKTPRAQLMRLIIKSRSSLDSPDTRQSGHFTCSVHPARRLRRVPGYIPAKRKFAGIVVEAVRFKISLGLQAGTTPQGYLLLARL